MMICEEDVEAILYVHLQSAFSRSLWQLVQFLIQVKWRQNQTSLQSPLQQDGKSIY